MLVCVLIAVCTALGTLSLSVPGRAEQNPSAGTRLDLPPRETPTPIATPTRAPAKPPAGGAIQLRLEFTRALDWDSIQTLVQWQDGLGEWHDVEGWCGTLDAVHSDLGRKTWWVSEKDFGTGPFRWVVLDETRIISASGPFDLPSETGQVVYVTCSLGAQGSFLPMPSDPAGVVS